MVVSFLFVVQDNISAFPLHLRVLVLSGALSSVSIRLRDRLPACPPASHTTLGQLLVTHNSFTCNFLTPNCLTQLFHTQLSHTQQFHTKLSHTYFGDIDLHFMWQALQIEHWASSGDALGRRWSPVAPRSFVWQAWHLVASSLIWYGKRESHGTGVTPVLRLVAVALAVLGHSDTIRRRWSLVTSQPVYVAGVAWHLVATFVTKCVPTRQLVSSTNMFQCTLPTLHFLRCCSLYSQTSTHNSDTRQDWIFE